MYPQQMLNIHHMRLRALTMFKFARVTKRTLSKGGEAKTAQVNAKNVPGYPPLEIFFIHFVKKFEHKLDSCNHYLSALEKLTVY